VNVQIQHAGDLLLEIVLLVQFTRPLPLLEPPLSTLLAAPLGAAGGNHRAAILIIWNPG
jgi:hypothetical protein